MRYLKIAILLIWSIMLFHLFILDLGLNTYWLTVLILTVLVTHIVEYFVFISRFKKASQSLGYHFMQMMLFGVFHYLTLKKIQKV